MKKTAIQIENLAKQYRLGTVGAGTLRGDFQRWMHRIKGKEDPFLKIGQENLLNRMSGGYVWALKDINLEVEQGEVLGIIGKNGAGKSTLLKILSRVTGPTLGSVNVNGRIASLLEVGTGFHQELTGRENIYLNGALLGMKKDEIRKKLDEIVEFAGVTNYIDTPVKRYSSGMHVRLAFAVAAHLDPEILIVDEVLSVGDAEFQKKAIGKMQESSSKQDRTVLFVSHNMSSVESLCNRTILIKNGAIIQDGDTRKVISGYLKTVIDQTQIDLRLRTDRKGLGIIRLQKMIFEKGLGPNSYAIGDDIHIKIIANNGYGVTKKVRFSISINTTNQLNLISCDSDLLGTTYSLPPDDIVSFRCVIKNPPLNIGEYIVNIAIYVDNSPEDWITAAGVFSIETGRFNSRERINHMPVLSEFSWIIE